MTHKESKRQSKVSSGTKIAAEMRAVANKLTGEQRDESMSFAMQVAQVKPSKKSQHPKPDAATVLARKDRHECNNLSDNQCEILFNEGMSLIYGAAVKPAPRAGH